jgi:uncharacterized membrane protein
LRTAVNTLTMTLACLAVASGASAAEFPAPNQAAEPLKLQYHCDLAAKGALLAAKGALRTNRGAKAVAAVSHPLRSAVSHSNVDRNAFSIVGSIPDQKCRSIDYQIVAQNAREPMSYSGPEVRSESRSKPEGAQYQARRAQYQLSAFEGVVAKSAERARPMRGDRALMIKIGLLFAFAYLVFLTLWIWVTRVRPRVTRPGRGI